ncbi:MAG TPA: hypothetical protein VFA52_01775 [Candidatus Paceibacterota bacterium]|nr:hypothetical protein [Candidatus Paceibacterota bacterium]
MSQEQFKQIEWESKEQIHNLADEVESRLPISDVERQKEISKIIVDKEVPAEIAPFVHKKVADELRQRKERFYESVGGKENFERGAKRNAFQNEFPEDL